MQIAQAAHQATARKLPSSARPSSADSCPQDSVEIGGLRHSFGNFGVVAGAFVGAGCGVYGAVEAIHHGVIHTGDPVGDVMLNTAMLCASVAAGLTGGAAVAGCQGYMLGWLLDRKG